MILVFVPPAFAAGPQTITLDGRLYDSSTLANPLADANVSLLIQVMNEAKTCVLYEERKAVDTSLSQGYFNVQIGSDVGSPAREPTDPQNSMARIFQNSSAINAVNTGCSGGYTPTSGERRYLRVYMTSQVLNATEMLQPDLTLDAVPTALVAESLQGLTRSQVLQIGTTADLTQPKVEGVFSGSNYTNLMALLGGSSTQYLARSTGGVVLPSRTTAPSSPADGQIWFDSVAGKMKYASGGSVVTLGTSGANSVGTTDLTDGSVTTAKIASGAVDGTKLASNISITTTGNVTANTLSSAGLETRSVKIFDPAPSATKSVQLLAPTLASDYVLTFPVDDGTPGQVLKTDGSGVLYWGTTANAVISSLTAATATNTIDNLNFAQAWNWSTASTQTPLTVNANALTSGSVLSLATSNPSVNSTNGLLTVANTGSSTNGVLARFQSNSTSGSGLTVLTSGNVGVGTSSPEKLLSVTGSSPPPSSNGLSSTGIELRNTADVDDVGLTQIDIAFSGQSNHPTRRRYAAISALQTDDTDPTSGSGGALLFSTKLGYNPTTLTERMRISADGNVGIGTSTPGQKLSVAGIIESKSGGFKFPDGSTLTSAASASQWTGSGASIYFGGSTVGIATSSPRSALDVNGSAVLGRTNTFPSSFNLENSGVHVLGSANTVTGAGGGSNHSLVMLGSANSFQDNGGTNHFFHVLGSSNTSSSAYNDESKLFMVGDSNQYAGNGNTNTVVAVGDHNTVDPNSMVSNKTYIFGGNNSVSHTQNTGTQIIVGTGIMSPPTGVSMGVGGISVFANPAGNVGIGTTSPTAKLEVNGSVKITTGSGGGIVFSDGTTQVTSANAQILSGGQTLSAPAGGTVYLTFGNATSQVSEVNRQMPLPRSGTLQKFYLTLSGSQPGSGSLVLTVRKNGVDTALIITVPAGASAGVYSNLTDSVSFAAGDVVSISLTNNASSGAPVFGGFSAIYQ